MAHPYAEHRADDRARASKLMNRTGYASGGAVDTKVTRGVHQHEASMHKGQGKTALHLDGEAKGKTHLAKRARGGKLTKVQVIVAPQGGQETPVPVPVPVPAKPPGMGAAPPPMPPPGAPPMGGGMMPAGGMPPGIMPPMPRARGGEVPKMEAGAMSGSGRIEKMHEYGEGGFKPKKRGVKA